MTLGCRYADHHLSARFLSSLPCVSPPREEAGLPSHLVPILGGPIEVLHTKSRVSWLYSLDMERESLTPHSLPSPPGFCRLSPLSFLRAGHLSSSCWEQWAVGRNTGSVGNHLPLFFPLTSSLLAHHACLSKQEFSEQKSNPGLYLPPLTRAPSQANSCCVGKGQEKWVQAEREPQRCAGESLPITFQSSSSSDAQHLPISVCKFSSSTSNLPLTTLSGRVH